jgi:hypothetical protein
MNKISMTKKYTTRDGRAVRVLAVDVDNFHFPVAATICRTDGCGGDLVSLTADGHFYEGAWITDDDLIEVVPFKKDDRVMVRNTGGESGELVRRHFHSMTGGFFRCYNDGLNSWSSNGLTSAWDECRAYDPKVDGE